MIIIKIESQLYPKKLKNIPSPPKILYVKGKILPKENCFAIVGARKCSTYGKQIASEIASRLCEAGFTIVSGLAPGIDTASHLAIVEKQQRTIAVLGTGLDEKTIYPQQNLKLAEKILEYGGALVSEYPPGTRGTRFSFPQRNRIISGLSAGILVVEAKEKSGALITAKFAKTQKRKIFAVPGPVYSLNSKGCHYLIKNGATLTESVDDILEKLNLPSLNSRTKQLSNDKNGSTKEEQLILDALKEEALYIDKITEKTKLNTANASGTLAILEIKGKVKNLGGNTFALMR